MTVLCSEAELQDLIGSMQSNEQDELAMVDRLIATYPEDARLHFLRGSILASRDARFEAVPSLRKAVELAPGFAIARFQLGFFLLTLGEADEALSTWEPLASLPESHYLRRFVAGLTHLVRDEFEEAVDQLRLGIAANQENPPLNHDMQLAIDQVSGLKTGSRRGPGRNHSAAPR